METRKPATSQPRSHEHNKSMSDRDKQKTVANPSPGSADPGNEGGERIRRRRH